MQPFPQQSKLSFTGRLPTLWRAIRANRFARIANSSDSAESADSRYKIADSIANDSRESVRANRVANRPCH